MAPQTRPRPSKIDLLPEECEGVVAWAVQELTNTARSQTAIYAEFVQKLEALQSDLGVVFDIPHFSSFNRHNLRLAKLTQKARRAQMIADAVVASSDGADADNLTQASTRMLKTLIFEMMEAAADEGFRPKEAMEAAGAIHRLSMAENVSSARREKFEADLAKKTKDAVTAVAKVRGLTAETADAILTQILGVEA